MQRTHDVIVIGAGAAGLTAAGGCAKFGLRVALVEAGEMGGECLNTGCVPSKALLAAAARAAEGREGARLGVTLEAPQVDFPAVMAHVHDAIAAIAPHDSQERFEAMGVEVVRARATLQDASGAVLAGNRALSAPRIVLATGSRPAVPPVAGLEDVPFLTNETLWQLSELPRHLLILGGGPIGMEMAQAFCRLGAAVTLFERGRCFGRDDAEAAALVTATLEREGVDIRENTSVASAEARDGSIILTDGDGRTSSGSHLLVASGRAANVAGLGLDAAGVECGKGGIIVDRRGRTSNRRIYAIGDCRDGPRFTHASGEDGTGAVVNIALGYPRRSDWRALPWVSYTSPELAQIGLTEADARAQYGAIEVERQDFDHNDRAVAESDITGFLKLIRHRGRLVGVTIVGARAGDMLAPFAQILAGKATLFSLASLMLPYPTRFELAKAAAFTLYEPRVFGAPARAFARALARFRR